MAATKSPSLTQRNLVWGALILVVGFAGGWLRGLVAAAVVLIISEIVERTARSTRRKLDQS